MYTPTHFKIENQERLHSLIRDNSFATLISVSEGKPIISHLPFYLKEEGETRVLLSHMAIANSHWKVFEKNPEVLVIFQGPHAYISPAWYPPDPGYVPTWNYTAVHAHGSVRILRETDQVWDVMEKLIESNEALYGNNWKVDKTGAGALIKQIVAFEIKVSHLEGKFKLSQHQPEPMREGVAKELLKSSKDAIRDTGKLMSEIRKE